MLDKIKKLKALSHFIPLLFGVFGSEKNIQTISFTAVITTTLRCFAGKSTSLNVHHQFPVSHRSAG